MPSDTGKKRRRVNKRIQNMLNDMPGRHSRVTVTRLDLRFPNEYQSDGSNDEIMQFHNSLRGYMVRHNTDAEYVTVREQAKSKNPHYHTMICTDGSKISKPQRLQEAANNIWKGIIGSVKDGLVHYPKNIPGHPLPALQMLKRPLRNSEGDEFQRQHDKFETAKAIAKQHGEYMAKEYSKGSTSNLREVFSSQRKKAKNTKGK